MRRRTSADTLPYIPAVGLAIAPQPVGNKRSGGAARCGSVWGWVDADGSFSIDFDDPASSPNVEMDTGPTDIFSGDWIDVWCTHGSGDAVIAHFIIP